MDKVYVNPSKKNSDINNHKLDKVSASAPDCSKNVMADPLKGKSNSEKLNFFATEPSIKECQKDTFDKFKSKLFLKETQKDSWDIFKRNQKKDIQKDTLGIFKTDSLKGLSDYIKDPSSTNSMNNARLTMERLKALETIEKSADKVIQHSNKENIDESTKNKLKYLTPSFNDFVPSRRAQSINISDLVTDETINLEGNASSSIQSKIISRSSDENISFEPSEITGRSTIYTKDLKKKSSNVSIKDILATSFSMKARNLGETMQINENFDLSENIDNLCVPSLNGSSSGFNGSRSLPRTADMSNTSKVTSSEMSIHEKPWFSISNFSDSNIKDDYNSEIFAPGELMKSKFLMDEASWADKFSAIPKNESADSYSVSAATTSSSLINDANFSVGKFFNMRSDKIYNIVTSDSPKTSSPIVLLNDNENKVSTTSTIHDSDGNGISCFSFTQKPRNSAYGIKNSDVKSMYIQNEKDLLGNDQNELSKKSFIEAMSAINKALQKLDLGNDVTNIGKISVDGLSCNLNENACAYEEKNRRSSNILSELLAENKENIDPFRIVNLESQLLGDAKLYDTLEMTNSILSPKQKKSIQANISGNMHPRSPLSPIPIPEIQITDSSEFEEEVVPVTPFKEKVINYRNSKENSPENVNAENMLVNAQLSLCSLEKSSNGPQSEKISLSSTRLDGRLKTTNESGFAVSPNFTKSTSMQSQNNTLVNEPLSHVSSPIHCDVSSPISSPCSGFSSHISSPRSMPGVYPLSPQLDCTTASEKRFLSGGQRKAPTSPAMSEPGINKYSNIVGIPPNRVRSMNSLKSTVSAGCVPRSSSRCSSSSEFSHRDGKVIPLKITCLEVSWGSTKLRTDSHKSLQIKNTSKKTLAVRIEVHGPGFQVINFRSNILSMQSQECMTIVLSFSPTVTGVAIGSLSFHAPKTAVGSSTAFLNIPLYGYGGHAQIMIDNTLQGPVGNQFLPMGKMCELGRPLERSIKIWNRGSLMAFAMLTIDCLGLNLARDCFEVVPDRVLISPGSSAIVRCTFQPKREDIKKISKKMTNVLQLANMRVIGGDEPNRQRLRRLMLCLTDDERGKFASLRKLWTTFPNEPNYDELETISEVTESAFDLSSYMRIIEVSLTLNNDFFDESRESTFLYIPDADETVLFRTICTGSSSPDNMLDPVDELLETTMTGNCDVVSTTDDDRCWTVEPLSLVYDFNNKHKKNEPVKMLIHYTHKSRQYFEISCNCKDLFSFSPNSGYLDPDCSDLYIRVNALLDRPTEKMLSELIVIIIEVENERVFVPVNAKV